MKSVAFCFAQRSNRGKPNQSLASASFAVGLHRTTPKRFLISTTCKLQWDFVASFLFIIFIIRLPRKASRT